jgi:hypothetical protein
MDYKEQDTNFEPESPDYSAYESSELERLFENAETDSEAYTAIMEELTQRGYNFEQEPEDTLPLEAIPSPPQKLRYSVTGTRLWNFAALLIGILGAAFFLKIQASFGEIDQSLRVMVYSMVALLVSLSYIISGIRLLANHKDQSNPLRMVPTFEYWFLCVLWFGFAAYEIYISISSFMMYFNMQLGAHIALYATVPSITMAVFSFLLGMAMLYLAVELKVRPQSDPNVPF